MAFVARELAPARERSGRKRLNAFFQANRAVCDRACYAVQREQAPSPQASPWLQGGLSDFGKGRH